MRTSSGSANGCGARLECIACKSARELRAFFALSSGLRKACHAPKAEDPLFADIVRPPRNPLLASGAYAFLLIKRGGRGVMRALTGAGWFALFDGENDPEAARLLFDEMKRLQDHWKSDRLDGPIAPDLCGYYAGLLADGFNMPGAVMTPDNRPWCESLLLAHGFRAVSQQRLYQVPLSAYDRLDRVYPQCLNRFDIKIERLRSTRPHYEAVYRLLGKEGYDRETVWRCLERLERKIAFPYTFVAFRAGKAAGVVLCLRDGKNSVRVASMAVESAGFSHGVTVSLLGAVAAAARERGIKRITAGVIDDQNLASLACVFHFDAQPVRAYRCYQLYYHKN